MLTLMLTLMVSPSLKARSNFGAGSNDNDESSAVQLSSVVTLASRFNRLRSLLTMCNKCCSLLGTEKQRVREYASKNKSTRGAQTSTKAVQSLRIRSPNRYDFENLIGTFLSEDACVVQF